LEANHPKNQHYVPQLLLRNFADKNERLFVFDKLKERTFPTGIRNIASETAFYDFHDETGEEHSYEYFMQRLEAQASAIIASILDRQSLRHLTNSDRIKLSIFAAVQQLRVKGRRHRIKSLNEGIRKELFRRGLDPGNVVPEIDDTEVKRAALSEIGIAKETAKLFYNKAWILQQAPTGKRFYISDNPIALHNTVEVPGLGNLGLNCRGIEIYLPLNPEFCLMMLCGSIAKEFFDTLALVAAHEPLFGPCPLDTAPARKVVDAIRTGDPDLILPENVDHENSLQVIFASRFVMSAADDFDLAKEMIRERPHLKQPPRLIVQ
jgi:hypothetical protein